MNLAQSIKELLDELDKLREDNVVMQLKIKDAKDNFDALVAELMEERLSLSHRRFKCETRARQAREKLDE